MARGFSMYVDVELGTDVIACLVEETNFEWLSRVTRAPIVVPNILDWPIPDRALDYGDNGLAYVGNYVVNHLNGVFTPMDEVSFINSYQRATL